MKNNGIEINGNIGNMQVQQNCIDSTMNVTVINDSQFFVKAQEIIDSIKQYSSDFKSVFQENENIIRTELELAQVAVTKQDRPRLSKTLKTIKDIAKSIPANIIASGIVNLIERSGL